MLQQRHDKGTVTRTSLSIVTMVAQRDHFHSILEWNLLYNGSSILDLNFHSRVEVHLGVPDSTLIYALRMLVGVRHNAHAQLRIAYSFERLQSSVFVWFLCGCLSSVFVWFFLINNMRRSSRRSGSPIARPQRETLTKTRREAGNVVCMTVQVMLEPVIRVSLFQMLSQLVSNAESIHTQQAH